MAIQAPIIKGYSEIVSFNEGISMAIAQIAQQVLSNTTPGWFINITPGNVGYAGYAKRVSLAQRIALAPEEYSKAFAREIVLIDPNYSNETDTNNLVGYCTALITTSPGQGTTYTPFDVVAGVTINDLDL